MGVICFQFPIGRDAIQSAASAVQKGVNYSQAGAEFVFGDRFVKKVWTIKIYAKFPENFHFQALIALIEEKSQKR